MTISTYTIGMETFMPLLRTLSTLIDKGAEQFRAQGKDPEALAGAKLAPDMFPFSRQVQIACDHAKGAAARLTGREPPKFEDTEQTLDQLKSRIKRTLDYVEGVSANDYEGAEKRHIEFPLINDLVLDVNGLQYLRDWALPNFYFHLVTAYDILRNQGVDIGKKDFLAHAGYAIHPKGQQ
ncbi:MAG TPA: DUF1993 domain-containing protein [Steroidobacteraceae bacterium]|nr:DUF1993 domain-containing protein [Steroidobacteraceae bacterium]